jgi:1A family penicillin-binding protein
VAAVIVLVPLAYIAFCLATIPLAGAPPPQTTPSALLMQADDGHSFALRGVLKGENIAPDQIPPIFAKAVTDIEDRRFYSHGGIDLHGTMRAAWHDVTGGHIEGGSTITQQLARRLYLTPERSLRRKVQEALLAIWLDHRFSKQQILAQYLNTAYFGDGAYGIDAAAKRYFGKTAQQLTLSEAAMLAGLIRAPSELDPSRNFVGAEQRAAVVLGTMVREGDISQQQADTARQKPAALRVPAETPPGGNYFIDAAAAETRSLVGSGTLDLTVRTTLNSDMQKLAESVVAKRLAASGRTKNAGQAALVALAPDGAVLAMVGGRDYRQSQFNRVSQARRQPGSLFKLFVYLTALRQGYTPDSIVVDQPVNVGSWEPDNYGDRYYGPVTVRTAFAHSLNSVAVQLAEAVGINRVIGTAKQFGVRSDLPAVPSVALGSGEVTLLEMTRAFANVAANTTGIEPYAVRSIANSKAAVYTRPEAQFAGVDNPVVHAEALDLLTSVVREGTGRAARLDRPAGGKTGTSEDYHDAWFIGFTADLIVGVWVGNDDNTPMDNVTGGSLPASIWHDFVRGAETVRRHDAAPTIAFNEAPATAAEASATATDLPWRSREPRPSSHQPFRFLWFRF